jgi:hypothetical protein
MGASLSLFIATGCQGVAQSPASSSTPSRSIPASTETTATPTASPTPLITPTATVEVTKAPLAFDVEKLVADIASGEAKNEYPAVTAAALKTELDKLAKTNTDVANIPEVNENTQKCTSNIVDAVQYTACVRETADLVILANKSGNPAVVEAAHDLIGYSLKYVFDTPQKLADYASTIAIYYKNR